MKTRLVPPLTPEEAAALSSAMAEALMERLSRWSRSVGTSGEGAPVELELRYTGARPDRPDRADSRGLVVPRDWNPVPQGSGDLGARLARTVEAAAAAGVQRLVIVGSDSPLLPLPLVDTALTLGERDAALAPAEDGGFVLLGLATGRLRSASTERLFRSVPWGNDGVFTAIVENAATAGLDLLRLPGHWDVDRPEDLSRLHRELVALPSGGRPRRLAVTVCGVATRLGATPLPGITTS